MAYVAYHCGLLGSLCSRSGWSALVAVLLLLADVGIELQRVELIGLLAIIVGFLWYTRSADFSSSPQVGGRSKSEHDRGGRVSPLQAKSQPVTFHSHLAPALSGDGLGVEALRAASLECTKAYKRGMLMSSRESGQWERALQCLYALRSKSVVPSVAEYSLVMASCNRSIEPRATLQLFELMKEDGQEPDILSYQDAIRASGMMADAKSLSRLLSEVQERGLQPAATFFAIAIQAFGRCGCKEECWKTYESMRSGGVSPNHRVFKALSEVMDDSDWREKGLSLLATMVACNEPPSIQIQSYLLCAWKSKPPEVVIRALLNLRDKGFVLSSTAYRCIMASRERVEPELTLELYKEMVEKNIKVDRVAYNAALCACSHLAKHDQAMKLFKAMVSNEFSPTGKTYGTLIKACAAGDRLSEVFELWEAMNQQRLRPNRFAYHDVIECHIKARRPGAAVALYREMVRAGVTPCDATFHCLMRACGKRKWTAMAASLEADFKVAKSMQKAKEDVATMLAVDSDDTSTQPSRHCQSDEGTDDD